MTVVAYQGAPGSFSERAARRLAGKRATLVGCRSFEAVFSALRRGRADCAVVPVENAIVGPLPFLRGRSVRIVRRTTVAVDLALLGIPAARLRDVRRILGHPVALTQCNRLLRGRRVEPVWDGAGILVDVVRRSDPSVAVIASRRAARAAGARVLVRDVADRRRNFTRFALVVPAEHPVIRVADRTARCAPPERARNRPTREHAVERSACLLLRVCAWRRSSCR